MQLTANCYLQTANYKLPTANCNLQFLQYKMNEYEKLLAEIAELQEEVKKVGQ